jgi:phage-related baseplate assembly protein
MDTSQAPSFLTTDQAAITEQMIAAVEAALGKTLYASQLERILVDCMAYREALLRLAIQSAAQENLVDFATGARLEALGRLLKVPGRIAAEPATTTWQITLPATSTNPTMVSSGFEATDPSGLTWRTTADLTIAAGGLSGTVAAQCETAGTVGNGNIAGTSYTGLTGNYTIASMDESAGGTADETDTALRIRILAAPYAFSVAGPAKAYYYHTLSADSSIIDAAVVNGGNGVVLVYPLTASGLPSATLLATVQAALDPDTVVPLNDLVQVLAPTEVSYVLRANITVYATADSAKVLANCQAAAAAYVADRASGLKKDLIASQAIKAIQAVDGVYKVELVGWADQALAVNAWANGTVSLSLAGTVND